MISIIKTVLVFFGIQKKQTDITNQLSEFQDKVNTLEKQMLNSDQVKCNVVHRFGPGVYIREVNIPANTIAVGHHQNFEHMNVFLKGRVTMINEDGTHTELVAPMIFTGQPGRKVGYIHEDMVWLNIYPTTETDIEKLENYYLTKSDGWVDSINEKNRVAALQSKINSNDYQLLLGELNITESQIQKQVTNKDDITGLPYGNYKIKVSKSIINGEGIFATADIESGELLAPARISGKRTIAGRYTNHSKTPNAKMVAEINGDIALVAIKEINGCRGGLDGDEVTVNYRDALKVTMEIGGIQCQQ